MSFEVKNIEQENINHKIMAPISIMFIAGIIASLVFVYYYFVFEKDYIMEEHYLAAESKIKNEYDEEQNSKYLDLGIDAKIDETIKDYKTAEPKPFKSDKVNKTESIESRLNAIKDLEGQLLSDAFVDLIRRGSQNKKNGVQSYYGKSEIKKIQKLVDYKNTYKEFGGTPDGIWGPDTQFQWREWKQWMKARNK